MATKKKAQPKTEDMTKMDNVEAQAKKAPAPPTPTTPQPQGVHPGMATPSAIEQKVDLLTAIELKRQAQQAKPPLTPQEQFEIDMRPYGGVESAVEFVIPEWGENYKEGTFIRMDVTVKPLYFQVGKKYKAPIGIKQYIWGMMGIPDKSEQKAEPTEVEDMTSI